jgi:uncharacterized protein (DUF1778 family)
MKMTAEQLFIIERAAELTGISVSGFIRHAALKTARALIAQQAVVD